MCRPAEICVRDRNYTFFLTRHEPVLTLRKNNRHKSEARIQELDSGNCRLRTGKQRQVTGGQWQA